MNFQKMLESAKTRHVLGKPITFTESFLRFVSYVEKDDSLYPYWKVFKEEDKFKFIDFCFEDEDKYVLIDYIDQHREGLWSYMAENSEFSFLDKDRMHYSYYSLSGVECYYIPKFTVCSIYLLGRLENRYAKELFVNERFIMNVTRCEGAMNYFNTVFDKLDSHRGRYKGIYFSPFFDILEINSLPIIRQSIMQKISELSN